MFKIDQAKSLFDCGLCEKMIVDPITLVCGYTICKSHTDKMIKDSTDKQKVFKCEMCNEEHCVPDGGFVVSKLAQKALELEFHNIKLSPIFDECKQLIKETKESAAKIEAMANDSESFIYEYFTDLKNKVDLRREELKLKIDENSDQLVQSIEESQSKCTQLSRENKLIKETFDESNKKLNKLIEEFNIFEFNDKKFEGLKKEADALRINFDKMTADYKISLLNNKKFSFEFEEADISDVFGKIIEIDDENRAEATFQLMIEDFTKFKEMKDGKLSTYACIVRNMPWKILAKSKQTDKGESELGFYLQCNTESKSTNWSVRAVAELHLVHQTDPEKNLIKKIEHLFCFGEKGWGYHSFIAMKEILEQEKGLFCRSSLLQILCHKFSFSL
jgi:hypothetical protein